MKKKDLQNYIYLIGMTKKEILEVLGEEFNYYPNNLWHYVVRKNRWGKKWVLYINFDNENKVISEFVVVRYWKI